MQNKIAQAILATIDNEIDQSTGTIRLRATSDNKDESLFPNQFVNVRMLLEEKRGVVLLSSAAIQRTTNSTFVYLVKPDSTVTLRNIKIGTMEGDNSEITEGLQNGDVVVMAGADKLQEGSKVNAQISGEPQTSSGGHPAPGSHTGQGAKGGKQKP
jgi:multidrug efflux system membrane fusion protein